MAADSMGNMDGRYSVGDTKEVYTRVDESIIQRDLDHCPKPELQVTHLIFEYQWLVEPLDDSQNEELPLPTSPTGTLDSHRQNQHHIR